VHILNPDLLWSVDQRISSNTETQCVSYEGHKVSNLMHVHCYLNFKNSTNCVNVNKTVSWFQGEINVNYC
jgi:hypothetical protein